MDSLIVSAGTDSLVVDRSSLLSILSEDEQLRSFMIENSVIFQQISLQLHDTLIECGKVYERVQGKLTQLGDKLPQVIEQAECIKTCIDEYHKNSTKASVAGSSTSMVGGALMLGGLIGAPYTFGASLGFTFTGALLAGAGGVTTAGAKIFNYFQSNKGNNEVQKMVEEVKVLCKEAQSEYEEFQRCCEKLGNESLKVCPALHAKTKTEKAFLGFNIFGFFHNSPSTAIHTAYGSKVAFAFVHALGTAVFGNESTTTMATFTNLAVAMKTIGGTVIVVGGLIINSVAVGYAAHQLVSDEKCPTSEGIAKQIEELKLLQNKIKEILTVSSC
ncbi:uncharacterized protein [Dysidea avara]